MKEQDLYKPFNMTEKEREQAGEFQGFIRIAFFKSGLLADGGIDSHKAIVGIARLLGERPDFAEMIITAVKLNEAIQENPILKIMLDAIMQMGELFDGEDCKCPACTIKRATFGQKPEQN